MEIGRDRQHPSQVQEGSRPDVLHHQKDVLEHVGCKIYKVQDESTSVAQATCFRRRCFLSAPGVVQLD